MDNYVEIYVDFFMSFCRQKKKNNPKKFKFSVQEMT